MMANIGYNTCNGKSEGNLNMLKRALIQLCDKSFQYLKNFRAYLSTEFSALSLVYTLLLHLMFSPAGSMHHHHIDQWLNLPNVTYARVSNVAPAEDIDSNYFTAITEQALIANQLARQLNHAT